MICCAWLLLISSTTPSHTAKQRCFGILENHKGTTRTGHQAAVRAIDGSENAQRCGIFIICQPARQTRGLVCVLTALGFLSLKLISTYQRGGLSSRVYLERLASALPVMEGQSAPDFPDQDAALRN